MVQKNEGWTAIGHLLNDVEKRHIKEEQFKSERQKSLNNQTTPKPNESSNQMLLKKFNQVFTETANEVAGSESDSLNHD